MSNHFLYESSIKKRSFQIIRKKNRLTSISRFRNLEKKHSSNMFIENRSHQYRIIFLSQSKYNHKMI